MRLKQSNLKRGTQRGAALVVGLIFLAMLSLMGVAAYTVATQEERMAGNTRDRIRAFEAAEASLRDCESLVAGFGALPNFNGTNGMHVAAAYGTDQVFETVDWISGSVRPIPNAVTGVSRQPRCIIERIDDIWLDPEALGDPLKKIPETIYRITARGFGVGDASTATLQTYFRRK